MYVYVVSQCIRVIRMHPLALDVIMQLDIQVQQYLYVCCPQVLTNGHNVTLQCIINGIVQYKYTCKIMACN